MNESTNSGAAASEGSAEAAHIRKFRKELNAGSVSLVLLALLERSGRPMYGYEIAKKLETVSEDTADVKQGTLYPALRAMERDGLLSSSVEPSVSGPPRRYYGVTDLGRRALADWSEVWDRTRRLVEGALSWEHEDDDG